MTKYHERSKRGIRKYGTNLDRKDVDLLGWLNGEGWIHRNGHFNFNHYCNVVHAKYEKIRNKTI